MEQKYMATGRLWAKQGNGKSGTGMPQQQFVTGGDFATALSTLAAAKLADVMQELREVGEEIALIMPTNHNVPLSAQQHIHESGAAMLIELGAPVLMLARQLCFLCCAPWGSHPLCRELPPPLNLHLWVELCPHRRRHR